jgi:membrane associated rhomboid family serine protease
MSLCAGWVVVYLAMMFYQGSFQPRGDPLVDATTPESVRVFGSMNAAQLHSGQVWRPITATFFHFGLLHLGINLAGLFLLGRMVEEWYGPALFLTLYTTIAFLGNLLAGTLRWVLNAGINVSCGGGSSVLCGLVALVGVVGWRSRTRFGTYVKNQMIGLLIFTGLLGLIAPVDNFGHAGGAIIGGIVGLGHRRWMHFAQHRGVGATGVLSVLVLVGAGVAQGWTDYRERQNRMISQAHQRDLATLAALGNTAFLYLSLANPKALRPPGVPAVYSEIPRLALKFRIMLSHSLTQLDRSQLRFSDPANEHAYQHMIELAKKATVRRATPGERNTFESHFADVYTKLSRQINPPAPSRTAARSGQ